MSYQLKALRESRAEIRAAIVRMGDTIRAENRPLSDSERSAFDRLQKEFVSLGDQIRAAEERDKFSGDSVDDLIGRSRDDGPPSAEVTSLAFAGWARATHGMTPTPRQSRAMAAAGVRPTDAEFSFRLGSGGSEFRDQGVGTGGAGGYLVPQGFSYALDRAMKAFAKVRTVANVIRTDTGAAMPYPTMDDTSNTGERLSENTAGTQQDVTFGSVTFNSYKYGSKPILVSSELLQDSAFDMDTLIGSIAGERIGRIQAADFTTGTGTGQPQGLVTGASAGLTTAGATAITADEVIKLFHSVDPAYRGGPSFGFMMNDGVLLALALLKDSQGRPLFVSSYRDGTPSSLYGAPVFINQQMQATIATGTVTILCGDFSHYGIRDAGEVRVRKLQERYADKDQVGFLAFMRSDGRYTNTAAVKKLTQA